MFSIYVSYIHTNMTILKLSLLIKLWLDTRSIGEGIILPFSKSWGWALKCQHHVQELHLQHIQSTHMSVGVRKSRILDNLQFDKYQSIVWMKVDPLLSTALIDAIALQSYFILEIKTNGLVIYLFLSVFFFCFDEHDKWKMFHCFIFFLLHNTISIFILTINFFFIDVVKLFALGCSVKVWSEGWLGCKVCNINSVVTFNFLSQ